MRTLFALLLWVATASALLAGPKHPLTLGAVGFSGEKVDKSVRDVADYLSKGMGMPITVELFPKYEDVLVALEKKGLDLAILTPINFLIAEQKLGVQPIANPIYQSGEGNYRAVILASLDRKDLNQLTDLKGKKVAFVDPNSASGYIVPRGLLAQAGLKGKDAVTEVFTGNHLKSIQSLIAKEVDAAATYDMLLSQNSTVGKTLDDFSVLARSDPIPSEVLVGSRILNKGHITWIKTLLLEFGEKRRSDPKLQDCVYQWFFGYDESRYDTLRKLWKSTQGK
jgi:phosphonate transport system substrate-binding protein